MRKAALAFVTLAAAALGGCARQEPIGSPSSATGVRAELVDTAGRVVARALARDTGGRLTVNVEAEALAPGAYGAHIHSVGRCDPPAFDTAGPHWNPTDRQHGSQNPQGQHLGDLPNLMVGADGQGNFEFTIGGATLNSGPRALLDRDGSALVIHAAADDYRTDPSGNSGARIACGVFR